MNSISEGATSQRIMLLTRDSAATKLFDKAVGNSHYIELSIKVLFINVRCILLIANINLTI
jgi:hypothetical protein